MLESCEDVASHLQRGIRELPSTKALDRLLVEGKGGCCVAVVMWTGSCNGGCVGCRPAAPGGWEGGSAVSGMMHVQQAACNSLGASSAMMRCTDLLCPMHCPTDIPQAARCGCSRTSRLW